MNVIGIIQTDLNEFNVLFEAEPQGNQGAQSNNNNNNNGNKQQEQNQDESIFLSFLGEQGGSGDSGQQEQAGSQNQSQNQSGPQEMTVRIKGVPEGQKATFLQMYQIIQDAKGPQDLERNLTIVNRGEEQGQGGKHQQKSR